MADAPDLPVVTLARTLLGRVLISDLGGARTSGIIVETEAYLGVDDPASHAWQGRRWKSHLGVWSPPGSWYVYRSYGIHWCLNLTADPEGLGSAVLIRALEPREGITAMQRRRGDVAARRIADGPGKLTQALAITDALDGTSARGDGPLRLGERDQTTDARRTVVTPRIGISRAVDWPLRFVLAPPGQ